MTENDDRAACQRLAAFKAGPNKSRTDALALICRYHCHWGQSHQTEPRVCRHTDRRKHDVTDNCRVYLGNERNKRLYAFTQRFNKLGLGTRFKGRCIDSIDYRPVALFFSSNEHGSLYISVRATLHR